MLVYNTLTNRKEEFVPIEEGKVRMYVCGPTVYNFFHIGNARPFVVFDTLRRYFKYRGYEVKFVQNFTDVDDKIINRAKEEGITAPEVSEKYIKEYYEDAGALNVIKADVHPKVSEHIPAITGSYPFSESLANMLLPQWLSDPAVFRRPYLSAYKSAISFDCPAWLELITSAP